MTRERTRTSGLGIPPLIQLLLEAVLCAFASLVQTLRTRRPTFHVKRPVPTQKDFFGPPGACPAVDAQRRTQTLTQTTKVAAAARREAGKARVPGEGRGPALRVAQTHPHRSILPPADWTPAFAGGTGVSIAN